MIQHLDISDNELRSKIRIHEICLAGNSKLKIYGILGCSSGKRLKRQNRVFFSSEQEAEQNNYRPCGHCMSGKYKEWRNGFI